MGVNATLSATLGPTSEDQLLRTLHDEHAPALWAYVVGLTRGDRAKAQDVVQETLLRAWRTPEVLAQTRGSARGWLYTVARRIVIDDWRSTRIRPEVVTDEVPEPHAEARQDTVGDAVANRAVVVAAMRTLSPDHRDVVLECYFRGSGVADAGRALGIPPGTVKSRLHYALRALRAALEDAGHAG